MDNNLREFWNKKDSNKFDSRVISTGRIEALNRIAEIAEPYLSQENTLSLDLGCGTGLFAEIAGRRNIVGVDFASSLLISARSRMDTVWECSISDLKLDDNSVDNILLLFVIDEYGADRKRMFLKQLFMYLKPGGRLFYTAYTPIDERMNKLREDMNKKGNSQIDIVLEELSVHEDRMCECGFNIESSEIIRTMGQYEMGQGETIEQKREFIIIHASKQ